MPKIVPVGARIFVKELEPETSLEKRAEASGLHLVILDENIPKPTSGIVVAIGNDPLIQEICQLGDTVTFARHAGLIQLVEGAEYRCLELREIIACIKPDSVDSPTPQEMVKLSEELPQASRPVLPLPPE